ncbi:MAG: putative 4-hydroxy-4-methyl-2-oxoglutarate aldolase, partial [Betaproteobacteria bacterium]
HGWAGVVVWGCIRDSVPVATMPLAVFALATHPLRSARLGTGERAIPVTIAGVAVNPGEYLYADDDGILIAPRRIEA